MKILFISENYYPNLSGVPVVVQYLAEKLSEYGNNVSVLTRKIDGLESEEIINSVNIYRINVYYNIFKLYCGEKREFVEFIKKYNADVNIFEGASVITTDIVLPYIRELNGIQILHSHGFSRLLLKPFKLCNTMKNTIGNTYEWIRWKKYFSKVLPQYINDFNGVFCLSKVDSSYKYLQSIYSSKVFVIGNAANDMFFQKSINKIENYTKIKGQGYFISVANYMAVKNQIGILEEYYKLSNKNYDLVFIGREKNYYYEALLKKNKKLQAKYGERNVHFLVDVNRDDIPGILSDAKLYLVGSTAEGYSISIIESMAQGVPFISTDVGNARLLPGGIVIKSLSEMHKKIENIMSNTLIYKKLSEQGKKYAEDECKISVATEKLLELIKECKQR